MRDGIYTRKQTRPFEIITAARLQRETHEMQIDRLQTVRDNTTLLPDCRQNLRKTGLGGYNQYDRTENFIDNKEYFSSTAQWRL